MKGWQFWIDRGGTFTDVIGLAPSGELHIRKVLSVQPGAPGGANPGGSCSAGDFGGRGGGERRRNVSGQGVVPLWKGVSWQSATSLVRATLTPVKVGTTVATNALLERKGEPVLLVTTAGFADGLRIGYQSRPDLFARHIVLPDRLYPLVIEANEGASTRRARCSHRWTQNASEPTWNALARRGCVRSRSFFSTVGVTSSTSKRPRVSRAKSDSRKSRCRTSCHRSFVTSRVATPPC